MKRQADSERDPTAQVVFYLEAIMFFILTGVAMFTHTTSLACKMLNNTLPLIK